MSRRRQIHPALEHTPEAVRRFFASSDALDYVVLRPLSHITLNWEACWDRETGRYQPEHDSFADDLNAVIDQIVETPRPPRYHDAEDSLAENVLRTLNWPIQKKGERWVGADYLGILEQGAFSDVGQEALADAASGRVRAALDRGQAHFDQMEDRHKHVLANLITIMIYHRYNDGTALIDQGDPAPRID